jgi:hypothetical protein
MPSPARLAAALITLAAVDAAAQPEDYQLTPPPGWTRTEKDGAVVLTPPGAEAEEARIIILPPRPLEGDFEAQATRERTAVEASLGLRDPQPEPARRDASSAGERLSHQARYAGEGGDRYAGFYSLASRGWFGLVVFYASSAEAFGRYSPPANALFLGLRITPTGARRAAERAPPDAGASGAPPVREPAREDGRARGARPAGAEERPRR